ncbi:MAG: hybrid sensor histidine kinase/response regulator [Anaerolineae bacterium]|nr:hybrid sensor histidine kinase/response regulator [Anaerolineae bacterium]
MTKDKDTLLIVDDSPENLDLLCVYLQGCGFSVLVAENGEEALQKVNEVRPDLILLDVVMPVMDGFETCQRLQENEATRDIPIIFMTALANTADKVKGFALGAVDHITKPLQPEEVLARITTHLTIKKLQKNLQEQISERDNLIAQLDAFAHTVAHDLKSPLGLITGYIGFLQDNWMTIPAEQRQEYLQTIAQTGYKMSNIIEELLLLASIRQSEVKVKPLDMGQIVAEALLRLDYLVEKYQAEVIVSDNWPVAVGHRQWVEEVWVNYVSNGLKYGGQPPRLELGAVPYENGSICFWIRDNGPGLTPEEQAQLFTRFTRLDQTRAKGYGLGLSIVQYIVEKLGGEVGVNSKEGHGSIFSFTLPAAIYQKG